MTHEPFIRDCFALARAAMDAGNHPFGSLLVKDGEVVLREQNRIFHPQRDVTAHPELLVAQQASGLYAPEVLQTCTLYASTEPCAMCTGAIFWAGIGRIVYSVSAQQLGDLVGSHSFLIPCTTLLAYGTRPVEVIGGVLADEGLKIHKDYGWNHA